ncbi:tetratricopeptide repeat protein [Sphingorhabdus sp. Alg239-R122]|uniref:tetratricopeptide repeat protein n=1 Tax=Sphingorhabdus sp. Alg239-R122 TaxID=2305989 RepID=UPI001F080B77|nr:tetratricopeptide repeat protein [Sphingorhabdus sp. Alg239-R122]
MNKIFAPLAIAAMMLPASGATAQRGDTELRVEKLEKEMRAVQRKVFPGGSERFFEPEIRTPERTAQTRGTSADTAVADLLARVDALEAQLAALTAQTEENGYKLGQLTARLDALEAAASEETQAVNTSQATPTAVDAAEEAAAVAAPSDDRVAQVAAIVKPDSGNAGEDEYIYGFRLWDAKFYPEAQQQLKKTVDNHPSHSRNSHARNLLGRAYMDDGKLNLAAKTFLSNYQEKPDGARAADSLYFLGMTMIQQQENVKACAAFDELVEVYPDVAVGRLSNDLSAGRSTAECQ